MDFCLVTVKLQKQLPEKYIGKREDRAAWPKTRKIVRYRKPLNINVGHDHFAMIFVYLSFSVYTYLRRDHVQFYEVVEGSIVNNKEYNGILFRDETVENAPQTGYVNYYVREGKRAGAGSRVYSLDETGELGKFWKKISPLGCPCQQKIWLI